MKPEDKLLLRAMSKPVIAAFVFIISGLATFYFMNRDMNIALCFFFIMLFSLVIHLTTDSRVRKLLEFRREIEK